MFTGLIEEIGRIRALEPEGEGARVVIETCFAGELEQGESVAVDGACLTVAAGDANSFQSFVLAETLRRTTLGRLRAGTAVNLERALKVGDRFGGHWVQGHVDGMGGIVRIEGEGFSRAFTFSAPPELQPFFVEKGSVAIDGISLTIVWLEPKGFRVGIIPETRQSTTLGRKGVGDPVNLECDLIAKYVFRYLETQRGTAGEAGARDAALAALLEQGGWGTRNPARGR